jgi:hypothetical protein
MVEAGVAFQRGPPQSLAVNIISALPPGKNAQRLQEQEVHKGTASFAPKRPSRRSKPAAAEEPMRADDWPHIDNDRPQKYSETYIPMMKPNSGSQHSHIKERGYFQAAPIESRPPRSCHHDKATSQIQSDQTWSNLPARITERQSRRPQSACQSGTRPRGWQSARGSSKGGRRRSDRVLMVFFPPDADQAHDQAHRKKGNDLPRGAR